MANTNGQYKRLMEDMSFCPIIDNTYTTSFINHRCILYKYIIRYSFKYHGNTKNATDGELDNGYGNYEQYSYMGFYRICALHWQGR